MAFVAKISKKLINLNSKKATQEKVLNPNQCKYRNESQILQLYNSEIKMMNER